MHPVGLAVKGPILMFARMTNIIRTAKAATLAALSLGLAATTAANAQGQIIQTQELNLQADIVAEGLEHPWGIDFLAPNVAIVTERPGRMRIFDQSGLSEPIEGVPAVFAQRQGGLLDVAVAPDFDQSGAIFFTFAEPGQGGAGTALARARLVRDGQSARLEDVDVIFSMNRKTTAGQHFGSRIVFNPDGTIFVTTGDRGDGPRSQDMQDHAGAVLRINADGSIPADNPYADGANALPEIWSKGHRNIQGATWDPLTNALWTNEHGPRGGDELHMPQAGGNYGWPQISYGTNYDGSPVGTGRAEDDRFGSPYFQWTPSIAPSGLVAYDGEMFPEWQGDFLVGALAYRLVARVDRDANGNVLGEERLFEGEFGRIRDLAVADDGAVWLITDESNGHIIRLSRAD
jgi:aldose sugar dehydrogenase